MYMLEDKHYQLRLFDTPGREGYETQRPLSYAGTDMFLICFSVSTPSSFSNVKDKWFPEVHHHSPGTPWLLVGTHLDVRQDVQLTEALDDQKRPFVSRGDGEQLARELGAFNYVECTALFRQGVHNMLNIVRFHSFSIHGRSLLDKLFYM
ncbi:hypothetical protein DL93DRAFT_1087258 [Clavulina sp. PMI_390]|nr:hypothetical protein DL93DRAFT_1087258 [Clavulina sp. PMI_390]